MHANETLLCAVTTQAYCKKRNYCANTYEETEETAKHFRHICSAEWMTKDWYKHSSFLRQYRRQTRKTKQNGSISMMSRHLIGWCLLPFPLPRHFRTLKSFFLLIYLAGGEGTHVTPFTSASLFFRSLS